MAWVIGIKQVTLFQPERDGKSAIPKPVRVVSSLLPRAIERTLQPPTVLPDNTGAGPCGTRARAVCVRGVLSWSIEHLVDQLAAYYAAYEPPRRFGAKDVPRGRRCA